MLKVYHLSEDTVEKMRKAEEEREEILKFEAEFTNVNENEAMSFVNENTEEIQEMINDFVNKYKDETIEVELNIPIIDSYSHSEIDVRSKPHKMFIKEYVAKFEAGEEKEEAEQLQ